MNFRQEGAHCQKLKTKKDFGNIPERKHCDLMSLNRYFAEVKSYAKLNNYVWYLLFFHNLFFQTYIHMCLSK